MATVPPGAARADPCTRETAGRLAQVTVASPNPPLVRASTLPAWAAGLAANRRVARRFAAAAGMPRRSKVR